MPPKKDISHFSLIDWDFQLEDSRSFLHNLCWYPSRFIPVIPAQLISALSKQYDVVLDPFCGAGTTIVEALKANRSAIGCDLNPVARFLTSLKSRILLQRSIRLRPLQDLLEVLEEVRLSRGPERDIFASVSTRRLGRIPKTKIPNFQENSGWFHEETLRELAFLFKYIEELPGGVVRDVGKALFLGILNSSSGHPGGRPYTYYADNVKPKAELVRKDAISLYRHKLSRFLKQYRETDYQIEDSVFVRVHQTDVRKLKAVVKDPVDLIITSPPYLNVTDYSTGFRLAYLWYDFVDDVSALKKAEIGPRWRRHSRDNLSRYLVDMDNALTNIAGTLRRGGYFCLVLGEPKKYYAEIKRHLVDTLCTKKKFALQDSYSRQISKKFFLHPDGGVPEEEILILRR